MLAMGGATAMVLMELRSIGGEGHSVGQAFGMGGMTGLPSQLLGWCSREVPAAMHSSFPAGSGK